MALKDLVASKATLNEAAIEAIVSKYVRYDLDHKEVALTPAGAALPAKKKVLVYLVALQGWAFVSDEEVPHDASPADLGDRLGMPGGTIRPMLMDLKDRHFIASKDNRYSVRAANLPSITSELNEDEGARAAKKPASARRKAKEPAQAASPGRRRNSSGGKRGSQAAKFEAWIDQGYFGQARSLNDVAKKFRQAGVIVARTSIPQLLLKAVRNERLNREEAEVAGKSVWVYRRVK